MERKSTMKTYLGSRTAILTLITIVALVAFMIYTIVNRNNVNYWGRRTLILAVVGLEICCLAAARDGLDKTIQCAIDKSCQPGIFSLISIPNIVGCIGAAIILVAGIVTIFNHKQNVREIMFYLMSAGITLKIVTVEIARFITLVIK